jgi:phospholipid/cholesterol/gamma-HCH transport system ATP-binding protein
LREPVIEVEGLWTAYDEQVVHRDISLTVYRGDSLAIVGGSGSGKTTLLRQMLGLEEPMRGTVRVFGEPLHAGDVDRLRRLRTRWGVLFQEGALFSALTVFENVALPLRELRTLDEELIRDLAWLKLGMVGIETEHGAKLPAELSGGMVKRVSLARALVLEPELLFLDEPTAGLDPDRSSSLVDLICALRIDLNLTVVMGTHDIDTLLGLSDRVAVLYDQRLVAVGPVAEVAQMSHPFIRSFFHPERTVPGCGTDIGRGAADTAVPQG